MDGSDGGLVDADEYLQPKLQRVSPQSTTIPESPTPQNQTNWDREMLRYAAEQQNQQPNQHPHHPSRYCSDPLATRGE